MRARTLVESDVRLQITPLIDVTFLLLIFFMCAMKFKTLERKVAAFLPKTHGIAHTSIWVPVPPRIQVLLRREPGEAVTRVKLLDTEIGTGDEAFAVLDRRIHQIHAAVATEDLDGYIDASASVPHAEVVRCLDSFLAAGVDSVEFRGAGPPGRDR